MAPKYVAPSPVTFASRYSGSSGGGGGGGGGFVQLRDSSGQDHSRLQEIGLRGLIENDQQAQQFQQRVALQQQAANLDVWQFQQKVTEQEALQLRQDQNAIAAIDSDPTLTPLEKMQAKTRIKTRIDFVSERQKRDMMQQQMEMQAAHAKAYLGQAELDAKKAQAWTAAVNGRFKNQIRNTELPRLKKLMAQAYPHLEEGSPEYIQALDQLAIEENAIDRYVVGPNNELLPDPFAEIQARQQAKATGTDGEGGARSGTRGGAEDVDRIHEKAMAHATGQDGAFDKAKYDNYWATLEERKAKSSPEVKKAKMAEEHQKALGINEVDKAAVREMSNISTPERAFAMRILGELEGLMKEHPPGQPIPKAIERRMFHLREQFRQFKATVENRGAFLRDRAQGGEARPQPAPGVSVFGGLDAVMPQDVQEKATMGLTAPLRWAFGENK
jgi:hypothetical protein